MRRATAFAIGIALWSAGCAVPVAPSGGPPDREPPQIMEMTPANNAVNFAGSRVTFLFSEHVDEASFLRSLEITPEPATNPRIKWDGKLVEINFQEPPEENTTYILTISTALRDLRNVSLKSPITRAFSTGSEINSGSIAGRILEPVYGSGLARIKVYAYAISDTTDIRTLPDRPLYRTETDESGNFELNYLSNRAYFVLGVGDRNSNRRPDNMEVVAVPPALRFNIDTTSASVTNWFAAVYDTLAPEVRRIQAISADRVSLRYDEDVFFDLATAGEWTVSDSSGADIGSAETLYHPQNDRRLIVVVTPPLPRGQFLLTPGVVSDSSGNAAARLPLAFPSDGRKDTAEVRLESFLPRRADGEVVILYPDELGGIMLSVPADTSEIAGRITVTDTLGMPVRFTLASPNSVEYYVRLTGRASEQPYSLRWRISSVSDADSLAEQRFRRLTERDLGSIGGVVVGVPDSSRVIVAALRGRNAGLGTSTILSSDRRLALARLLPGAYRLRFVRDDNRNGRWDPGRITPYNPPEPIFWTSDSLRVRARWETDVDTLTIIGFTPE